MGGQAIVMFAVLVIDLDEKFIDVPKWLIYIFIDSYVVCPSVAYLYSARIIHLLFIQVIASCKKLLTYADIILFLLRICKSGILRITFLLNQILWRCLLLFFHLLYRFVYTYYVYRKCKYRINKLFGFYDVINKCRND